MKTFLSGFFYRLLIASTALALGSCAVFGDIPWPTINTNNVIVVTNVTYGAVGDSVTTNTTAIQKAINAASLGGSTNGLSGGVVEIPAAAGTYLCGPLTMSNFVDLQIDAGATLQMLPYGSYPGGTSPTDFIAASKLRDIEISGFGTIDGQGAVWWATNTETPGGINRPKAMFAPTACNVVLIRDITLQNPPNTHISFRSSSAVPCGNVMVTNLTINTPDNTPNTDGIDLSGTNVMILNSSISDGDDHIAISDSSAFEHDIIVTNCLFGTGHGVSFGSFTQGGASNVLVINCGWNGSENGIRIKSQRGRGGLVQDAYYQNLSMTNVQWPILIYSYYNDGVGTLEQANPYMAATDVVQTVNSSTPIWQNIFFTNVNATTPSGNPAVMIWGLPEMLISNVVLDDVNINGSAGTKTCEFYNVTNLQILNSKITVGTRTPLYTFFDDHMTVSNSQTGAAQAILSGLSTNGILTNMVGSSFTFYNVPATLQPTNSIANGTITMGGGMFTVSNNLSMLPEAAFDYQLGTSAATTVVKGNLELGGNVNITASAGFTNGTYTLFTYTGGLTGSPPTLGSAPPGFDYAFDTSVAGKVNLDVTLPVPPPANLTAQGTNLLIELQWLASAGASGYDLMRSTNDGGPYSTITTTAATNYSDNAVGPGVIYYYVVSATNSFGSSANSTQADAAALPSLNATNLNFQVSGNQLLLSWPPDHLGWQLQIQTNTLADGLGTNWTTVPDSTSVIATNMPISIGNDCVFYRLAYP
jgi:polygalacturonase